MSKACKADIDSYHGDILDLLSIHGACLFVSEATRVDSSGQPQPGFYIECNDDWASDSESEADDYDVSAAASVATMAQQLSIEPNSTPASWTAAESKCQVFELDVVLKSAQTSALYQLLRQHMASNKPIVLVGVVSKRHMLTHFGLEFGDGEKILFILNPSTMPSQEVLRGCAWYNYLASYLQSTAVLKVVYNAASLAYALKTALHIELNRCLDVQLLAELTTHQFGLPFAKSIVACIPALSEEQKQALAKCTYFTTESLGPWKLNQSYHRDRIFKVCAFLRQAGARFSLLPEADQAERLECFQAVVDDGMEYGGVVPVCYNKQRDFALASSAILTRLAPEASDLSQLPTPSCQIDQLLAVLPSSLRAHVKEHCDGGHTLREIVMDAGKPTMLYTLNGRRSTFGRDRPLSVEDVQECYTLIGSDKFGVDNRAGIDGEAAGAWLCSCTSLTM